MCHAPFGSSHTPERPGWVVGFMDRVVVHGTSCATRTEGDGIDHGLRCAEAGCTSQFVCPGCGNWQIEVPVSKSPWFLFSANLASAEHRADCPAFDMLAGLMGARSVES